MQLVHFSKRHGIKMLCLLMLPPRTEWLDVYPLQLLRYVIIITSLRNIIGHLFQIHLLEALKTVLSPS